MYNQASESHDLLFSAQMKWHKRYLHLAREISNWSKDPSTQIGAVAIGSKGQVLAQGYNGFPRNIKDTEERYQNRELKYKFIVHAEINLIYNATYNGVSLDGSTLYVYGLQPCSECAKGIIQVGVKTVIAADTKTPNHWKDSFNLTNELFNEADIKYHLINID